jgi:hypothetical protein
VHWFVVLAPLAALVAGLLDVGAFESSLPPHAASARAATAAAIRARAWRMGEP